MRRCNDNWVNATQILKLCDFPKAKRTKILEKGVQTGEHQKVQGGYGRFQGTWIPLESARNLAREFGIGADLVPVLYIDVDDPNLVIPKKLKPAANSTFTKGGTPVKRKYLKKTREAPKKPRIEELPALPVYVSDYLGALACSNIPNLQDENGVAMHMQRMPFSEARGSNIHDYSQMSGINDHISADSSFRSYVNYLVQAGPGYSGSQQMLQQRQQSLHLQNQHANAPCSVSLMEHLGQQATLYQSNLKSALSHATNETNWSQEDHNRDSDTSISSADVKNAMEYLELSPAAQMLRYFSEDNLPIPHFIYDPTPEFDLNDAIDDEGHTTLHWAASIGNLNLVLLVLSKGANPLVASNYGMNPLSKCITFNNCYDLDNFSSVLDALESCLIHTDVNGRTPLHYVCQFSKVRSKLPSLLHYTESMFKKIISIANRGSTSGLDLFRNVLNHQDINGDTCLHLAARSGCSEMLQVFLKHGARDDLPIALNNLAKSLILQDNPSAHDYSLGDSMSIFERGSQEQKENESSCQKKKPSHKSSMTPVIRNTTNGMGTPTQSRHSHTVTPDTQRTTVQEDDDEEGEDVSDHVSREQLRSLLEESTVDDNKENIFLEGPKNINYGHPSTQKASKFAETTPRLVSSKLTAISQSPAKEYILNPPKIDCTGHLMDKNILQENAKQPHLPVPLTDVISMLHGMVNSFAASCRLELDDLNVEQQRVQIALERTRSEESTFSDNMSILMKKNGLIEVGSLQQATSEAQRTLESYEDDLAAKEKQLVYFMEKYQSKKLNSIIEREVKVSCEEPDDNLVRLDLVVNITKAQLKRERLVQTLIHGMKNHAIDHSMNKYRKLISLSCGLRVEDIDCLIEGIEESLTDGSA